MKLIEQYEELIERNPSEISYGWKIATVTAYFLSSLSAYALSIAFNVFWHDICGGHCYFWSDVHYYERSTNDANASLTLKDVRYKWQDNVSVDHASKFYCNLFHFACLVSCCVAIILLMMFIVCGKGGYDIRLFVAPWRLVMPASFISLIMITVTMLVVTSFSRGYFFFSEKLYALAYGITLKANATFVYKRPCEVFQDFTQTHNVDEYDICKVYWTIQMCSWTMTWSWISSFFVLLMRILMSVDFSLLKVKILALPEKQSEREVILKMINEGKHSLSHPYSHEHSSIFARRKMQRKIKVL